jgi:hypothetical protein
MGICDKFDLDKLMSSFLHLLLLYYNHNEIISFVGLLKNILVYSCIFANKIALYTNVVCPNTLNMLYNTLGVNNEPEAQEGYYKAYYFVRTSKICIQSLFKEVKSIPHVGDLGGISTWITRRTGEYAQGGSFNFR